MIDKPEIIFIEEYVSDPLTKIMSILSPAPCVTVEDYKRIGEEKSFSQRAAEDKSCLALGYKKEGMVKNIGRMGSGQYYLFHEMDCMYDCEYCYLQYYFQTKVPAIFVN